ncbi:MAG: gamma-glutamyl-gamma-aminobutyrate hydrolase family protein [Phycisphaerales bacterium]|nr:MAG: gamma-glutamyl-gamma-aminobutyrate hydrolase family protein [Phycisphaerales bacterium]
MTTPHPHRPRVGITCDLIPHNNLQRSAAPTPYVHAVARAGGVPVLLPPVPALARELLDACDALVLTGGDDPRTEPFGVPTHPKAVPIHPDRQAFELELIDILKNERPETPVLGVCLGMQLMALAAGGSLDQHMPDTIPRTAKDHWEQPHQIQPEPRVEPNPIPTGEVQSKHRQRVEHPGSLRVLARAHDGVIEAIDDPARAFYLGVQWHPERTPSAPLGDELFQKLVQAAIS